jgi:hypothetical protein
LGRFWQIDPLAEQYVYNSPYALQENKFGRGVELEGKELMDFVNGVTTSLIDNNTLGITDVRKDNEEKASDKTTFKIGTVVGDLITAYQGTTEMSAGGSEAFVSTAGVATAPLSAFGILLSGHGAAVFSKSMANLANAMVNSTKPSDKNSSSNKNSKVEKSNKTEKIGENFTKKTEIRPGKNSGQS